MAKDPDQQIADAIRTTHEELEKAREVVRALANELADVADVIEPALKDHTQRLRQARMASVEEMREILTRLREVREFATADATVKAFAQLERFVGLCREIEHFRATGTLAAVARLLEPPK